MLSEASASCLSQLKIIDYLLLRFTRNSVLGYLLNLIPLHQDLQFILQKLETLNQSFNAVLQQNNVDKCVGNKNKQYSLYFLKGNDPSSISFEHQLEIHAFIDKDSLNSSILIYNPAQSARRMNAWKTALPWIQPHYAIKSSPVLELIKDLADQGAGMDCASKAQIQLSLLAGVNIDNIVYSNPIKNQKDLIWAQKIGIKLTVADTLEQLQKIQTHAPNMGVLWRIAIKQDTTDLALTTFSGKFGDDIANDEMIDFRMKQIAQMGINLKGIHFHCGSGMHGSSGFGKAIKIARRCMEYGRLNGHQMHTLDIGGGFPACDLPQSTINALKPTENDPLGYRVIAEPGRHMSSRCFYVATRIMGKRTKNGKPCYHLNQSVYHSFNCIMMDSVCFDNTDQFYSRIQNGNASLISEMKKSTLFGMTCDGLDIISNNINVPVDAKIGDWFCFGGMGAYTHGSKTNFNGMVTTEEVYRLSIPNIKQPEPMQEQTNIEYYSLFT